MKNKLLLPFKSRIFLAVWIATLFSNFGMQIHTMAAGWLMIRLDSSPQMVALVQVAASLPYMLFALLAGALSDIYNQRKVMLAAQLFSVIAAATLAFMTYQNAIGPWSLLVLVMMIAVGSAFYSPAWAASVSSMVPRENLPEAVNLNAINFNLGRSLAPALGGILITLFGVAWAFILNTISYLGIVSVLWRWKPEDNYSAPEREPITWAISMGLRYAFRTDYIRVVLIRSILGAIGAGIFLALMPVLAKQYLAGDATTFTILLTALGVGSVIGGFAITKLRENIGIQRSSLISQFVMTLSTASIVIADNLLLCSVSIGILGMSWIIFIANMNASIQLSAPDWIVGRLLATFQSAVYLSFAAGGLLWGWTASEYGIETAFIFAAVVTLLSCFYGLFKPMLGLGEVNNENANLAGIASGLNVVNTGRLPIVVTVRYHIDAKETANFLEAMARLKSVRLRLGVVNWTLQQELENPAMWIERYISKDWDEQKRRPKRYTNDDNQIRLQAESFDISGSAKYVFMVIRNPSSPKFSLEPLTTL